MAAGNEDGLYGLEHTDEALPAVGHREGAGVEGGRPIIIFGVLFSHLPALAASSLQVVLTGGASGGSYWRATGS